MYAPLDSSFISTHFFDLNLDGSFDATPLSNQFDFFDIPLLYCYANLNLSIICCPFSGDMYLFSGASVSSFCNSLADFETLVILSAILSLDLIEYLV